MRTLCILSVEVRRPSSMIFKNEKKVWKFLENQKYFLFLCDFRGLHYLDWLWPFWLDIRLYMRIVYMLDLSRMSFLTLILTWHSIAILIPILLHISPLSWDLRHPWLSLILLFSLFHSCKKKKKIEKRMIKN